MNIIGHSAKQLTNRDTIEFDSLEKCCVGKTGVHAKMFRVNQRYGYSPRGWYWCLGGRIDHQDYKRNVQHCPDLQVGKVSSTSQDEFIALEMILLTLNFSDLLSLGKKWKYESTWPNETPNILRYDFRL